MGNTLKGSKMFKMVFGNIQKHRSVDGREKEKFQYSPNVARKVLEGFSK
jgi:hypothetical protein